MQFRSCIFVTGTYISCRVGQLQNAHRILSLDIHEALLLRVVMVCVLEHHGMRIVSSIFEKLFIQI